MVAAEDDRHDPPARDLGNPAADVRVTSCGVAVGAVGVAEIDDVEVVEDLEVKINVVGACFVGERPDGARPEARPGAVGGRDVERRSDDGDVGGPLVELLRVGEEGTLAEGRQATEDVAELELLAHSGGEARVVAHGHECRCGRKVRGPRAVLP